MKGARSTINPEFLKVGREIISIKATLMLDILRPLHPESKAEIQAKLHDLTDAIKDIPIHVPR